MLRRCLLVNAEVWLLVVSALVASFDASFARASLSASATVRNLEGVAEVATELKKLFAEPGFLSRRGIVISAGGRHLLSNAYVTAEVIRKHHRSKLKILVVYCSAEEYDEELAEMLRSLGGVTLRDTCEDGMFPEHQLKTTDKPGWVKKVLGLYFAYDFEELLFLDADCLPLTKPEMLFEDRLYAQHGSLFWPDFQAAHGEAAPTDDAIYQVFGLQPPWLQNKDWMTTESGQFLLDRRRHADVLEMVLMLNLHHKVTYKMLFGDKDSFELAFALVGKLEDFQKVPVYPRTALSEQTTDKLWRNRGHVQNDRHGRPIFLHRTDAKLAHDVRNVIAFITSPVGPVTYARDFFYDEKGKALKDSEGLSALDCKEMDQATVALLHSVDNQWSPGCKGKIQHKDAPVFLIPADMFGRAIQSTVKAQELAFRTMHEHLQRRKVPAGMTHRSSFSHRRFTL